MAGHSQGQHHRQSSVPARTIGWVTSHQQPPRGLLSADPLYLIVDAGPQRCGLQLAHVVEVFRPLPIEMRGPAPAFVLGLAQVRGRPVPVVDLGLLLGGGPCRSGGRFVSLRVADRHVALLVDAVLGLRGLAPATLQAVPPLLGPGSPVVEALAGLDQSLLLLLRSACLFPAEAAV